MPGATLARIPRRITLTSSWAAHRIRTVVFLFSCLSSASASASAQDLAADFQAMGWASSCVTCHGGADAVSGSGFPRLVDLPPGKIQADMKEFAAGRKPGLLMPEIAKGYDEATIERIAKWFERIGGRQE